jgi:hypothetical protein
MLFGLFAVGQLLTDRRIQEGKLIFITYFLNG